MSKTLFLFDVDGTLTEPIQKIKKEMKDILILAKNKVKIGVVGGSQFAQISEQLSDTKDDFLNIFDYVFTENGLVAYEGNKLIHTMEIKKYLGEDNIKKLINFLLKYIADLDIPIKRGTFIQFRTGTINVSPIGRDCSNQERKEFYEYDLENNIRKNLVKTLQENFSELELNYTIGGMISIDIFPKGWDKTYCLQHVKDFDSIYFFGDKTFFGGNDYEIFSHPDVIGTTVLSPKETMDKILEKLKLIN